LTFPRHPAGRWRLGDLFGRPHGSASPRDRRDL